MPTLSGTRDGYPYPSGRTRAELRSEIAHVFGDHAATATGGTTGTLIDSKLVRFADDYWNGAHVWISEASGAAPQNETAYVTDFASSTGTLTVSPAFTVAPASGDKYELYLRFDKDEYDTAIARACVGAEDIKSLTPSASTLDYSLARIEGLDRPEQVQAVWWRASNSTDVLPQRLSGWRIEDAAGEMTLRLPDLLATGDGLWIEFLTNEDGMQHEDSRCNLPVALVKARACRYLCQIKLVSQDSVGLEYWGTLLRHWSEEVAREERRMFRRPNRVSKYHWGREYPTSSGDAALDALGLGGNNYGGSFANWP